MHLKGSKTAVRADGQGGCVDWNDDDQKKKAAEHARAVREREQLVS